LSATSRPRILIAGIGNIFFGDDAFGVEVVRRLQEQSLPPGVEAIDFGIRGFDLACAILSGYDAVILIDSVSHGGQSGALHVLEPDIEALAAADPEPAMEGHGLSPARVLQYVRALGGALPKLRLIGCEPATFGSDEQPQTELSPAVSRAVDEALPLVQTLVEQVSAEWAEQLESA
jgi:hydrogenase maturation protease